MENGSCWLLPFLAGEVLPAGDTVATRILHLPLLNLLGSEKEKVAILKDYTVTGGGGAVVENIRELTRYSSHLKGKQR